MNAEKAFLFFLSAVLAIVTWYMVKPFVGYIMGALLLSFLLYPLHRRVRKYIGERFSAFSLMVAALLLAVVPLWLISAVVIKDAQNLSTNLNQTEVIDTNRMENQIRNLTGRDIDIETSVRETVRAFNAAVFGNVSRLIDLVTNLLVGFTLMMFLIYYLLKDGERFVRWLQSLIPLSKSTQNSLTDSLSTITWAVMKGHVLVSFVQAIVAGIALVVTGVPNPFFWTFVMVVLGFLPVVGSALVWLPASIYLFVIGEPAAALFLFLYGVLVVSLVDNIVRPIAVDRSSHLHPAVVLLGVIGGLFFFGAVGLFVGPILLGLFKSVLIVFGENYS